VGQSTVLHQVNVLFSSSLTSLKNNVRTHQTLQKELASSKKQGNLIFTALTTHQTPTFKVTQRHFMHYKGIFRTPVFVTVALLSLKRLSAEGLWGGLLYWGP
jgi:hypothetical protein